ncbi:DUF4192 domain-containing protein [uncultured Nocardioides sp.]|uniref:DUF4192 domain-containing protein n=1 Tax=uncultured Nocardioides sp. TaxID=198441 RepID=UPI002612A9CA|nr:DUF4192 domain-containing protein [uncultured Nocardioides sp.]
MTSPDLTPETPGAPPTAPGPTTEPVRLVARGRDDLLAMVPTMLGFVPAESVTMLTFSAARPFHARVDLPRRQDEEVVVALLLEPALRHRVGRVAFVVHSRRGDGFARFGRRLVDAFLDAGIGVVEVLLADGDRVWCLDCDEPSAGRDRRCAGHPYDVSAHPFVAHAVLEGRVVHASREELASTLEPDAAARTSYRRVAEAAARHGARLAPTAHGREASWLRRTVRRHLDLGTRPDDMRLGRVLADLAEVGLRDSCWERMDREDARAQVELWRDVVRRAPDALVGPAAGVLAYAAWLTGHGALAWCAVDRGRAHAPELDLLVFVARMLEQAVPPDEGDGDRLSADRAPGGPQVA